MVINREKCKVCGACVNACLYKAREIIWKVYTVEEVIKEVIRDRAFYWMSHGGVTVGGGEPLFQPEFVAELLRRLHEQENIHTAIETSGYGEWRSLENLLKYIDWIFYDIKCMDSERHRQLTGVSNALILENAKKVSDFAYENSIHLTIRVPVVPGCNDSMENIRATAEFVASLKGVNEIELLPYHRFGEPKYEWLGMKYPLEGTEPPKAISMVLRKEVVESYGVKCILPIPEEVLSQELIKEAIEHAEGKAELYSKV
jgi:pyruvate formate lyase activating enzyme